MLVVLYACAYAYDDACAHAYVDACATRFSGFICFVFCFTMCLYAYVASENQALL